MNALTLSMNTRLPFVRPLLWLGLAGLLAAVLAISASASQDPGLAAIGGEGAGTISGFTISEIHYALSANDPSRLTAVSFEIVASDGQAAPVYVAASVVTRQPASVCFPQAGLRWTCPLDVSLAMVDGLHVSATG